jgi:hypothetical protein
MCSAWELEREKGQKLSPEGKGPQPFLSRIGLVHLAVVFSYRGFPVFSYRLFPTTSTEIHLCENPTNQGLCQSEPSDYPEV